MKKRMALYSSIALASLVMTNCMGSGGNGYNAQGAGYNQNSSMLGTAVTSSSSSINSDVKSSLAYMYEEERLANEVYLSVYKKQPVQQLYRIGSNSERRHIDAVKSLAQKYGVATSPQTVGRYSNPHIQSLFNQLYQKGIRSQKDALEVGCIVEVTDVNDLNKYIAQAESAWATDVVQTYEFLRRGSYNHYWAFDRGLKSLGVSNGCCSLGSEYCHYEYPQNEKGQGRGQGRGHGRGHGYGGGGGGHRWQ